MTDELKTRNCYIGVKPCGCVTCAIMNYGDIDEIGETISDWEKRGMKVLLVNVKEAKSRLSFCCNHKEEELK